MRKSIYKPKYEQVIKRLRQARESAGMKQEDVAQALGKYQSYLSKIENGDRRIDIVELLELAEIYGKKIEYFVSDQEPKRK